MEEGKRIDVKFLIIAIVFGVLYIFVLFTFGFKPEIYRGIGFINDLMQKDSWAFMNKIYPAYIAVFVWAFMGLAFGKAYPKVAKVLYIIAGVCFVVTTLVIVASQFGIYDGFTPLV